MSAESVWSNGNLDSNVPIVDATEEIKFQTRPRDSKGAIARNPEACVAARGIMRTVNDGALAVKIGATIARIHYGNHIKRYIISKETQAMIKAYDKAGFYPSGVTVHLLPPTLSTALGARKGEKRGGKKTRNGKPDVRSPKTPWLRHIDQAPEQENTE
jgi:hypothetical protein